MYFWLAGVSSFCMFIIALELYTGFAFFGWAGDNMLIEKEKTPKQYWFAIVFHLLIFVALPIALIFV